jgi:hypothetical protein
MTKIKTIIWHSIELTIEHTPNWAAGMDHIAVTTAGRVALPITETGYRSHFLPPEQIAEYGDAISYVLAWLDHEAESKAWKTHEAKTRQLELF